MLATWTRLMVSHLAKTISTLDGVSCLAKMNSALDRSAVSHLAITNFTSYELVADHLETAVYWSNKHNSPRVFYLTHALPQTQPHFLDLVEWSIHKLINTFILKKRNPFK